MKRNPPKPNGCGGSALSRSHTPSQARRRAFWWTFFFLLFFAVKYVPLATRSEVALFFCNAVRREGGYPFKVSSNILKVSFPVSGTYFFLMVICTHRQKGGEALPRKELEIIPRGEICLDAQEARIICSAILMRTYDLCRQNPSDREQSGGEKVNNCRPDG